MKPGDLIKISEEYVDSELLLPDLNSAIIVGFKDISNGRTRETFAVNISDMFFVSERLELYETGELFFKVIGGIISIWVADFELHYIFEVVK